MGDVVGIGPDDAFEAGIVQEFLRVLLEVKHDTRAPLGTLRRWRNGEAAAALRCPLPSFRLSGPEGSHLHPLGDDEGGIEADAELADEAQIPLLCLRPFEEGLRARLARSCRDCR